MSESRLLQGLNPPQRDAVETTDGPLLVIAGAGSGKTRVITHRIAYLIEEKRVSPRNIFAATFTNKAAREMKDRVARLCVNTEMSTLAIATFHSQCANILRQEAENLGLTPKFTICDDTDQRGLMRDILRDFNHDPKQLKPQDVLGVISLAKMKLLDGIEAEEYIAVARDDEQAKLYRRYQERLRASDAVDFDDLLLLVVKLWKKHPEILKRYQTMYQYLLVDEYQDTNLAQFEVVRLLSEGHRNLCVVGDEDQSIYSWRGAELSNLLEFEKHFEEAKIIRLEQNYRSTGMILDAADAVIQHNSQRLGKTLWTDGDAGDPIIEIDALDERDEARRIAAELARIQAAGHALEECAVFYRVNALSRVYEDALRENDIPYQVVGNVGFYDRMEIKDLLCYLQVIANPGNSIALLRIINKPRRSIGQKSVQRIIEKAGVEKSSLFEVITREDRLTEAGLKGKAVKEALKLGQLIIQWNAEAPNKSVYSLGKSILRKTEYVESLGDQKDIEVLSRKENIDELLGAMKQWDEQSEEEEGLEDYLESVALREATDVMYKENAHTGVSLMTIHNAKGLEFDHVFCVAVERDIFPNPRALSEQGHAEEERRLFYVALTRARRRFYLSHARMRRLYGETNWPSPSPFVHEIPDDLKVAIEDARLDRIQFGPRKGETDAAKEDRLAKARNDLEAIIRRKRNQAEASQGSLPSIPSAHTSTESENASGRSPAKPTVGYWYRHPVLGDVEIVEEKGHANQRRFTVRDSDGKHHTIIAAFAKLSPLAIQQVDGTGVDSSESQIKGPDEIDEDALPF